MGFDVKECGKRMRALRKEFKLTQEQAAEILGISRDHLAHIEIGRYAPSIDLLIQVTDLYKTSLDYLVLGK